MPNLSRPSIAMRKFAHAYLKTGSAKEAARIAVPTAKKDNLQRMAYHYPRHPLVQGYLQKIMRDAGIDDTKIASALNKIIDAGTSEKSLKKATPGDSLKAIELSSRLADKFPAQKTMTANMNLNMGEMAGKTTEELMQLLGNMKEEMARFSELTKAKLKEDVIPDTQSDPPLEELR